MSNSFCDWSHFIKNNQRLYVVEGWWIRLLRIHLREWYRLVCLLSLCAQTSGPGWPSPPSSRSTWSPLCPGWDSSAAVLMCLLVSADCRCHRCSVSSVYHSSDGVLAAVSEWAAGLHRRHAHADQTKGTRQTNLNMRPAVGTITCLCTLALMYHHGNFSTRLSHLLKVPPMVERGASINKTMDVILREHVNLIKSFP